MKNIKEFINEAKNGFTVNPLSSDVINKYKKEFNVDSDVVNKYKLFVKDKDDVFVFFRASGALSGVESWANDVRKNIIKNTPKDTTLALNKFSDKVTVLKDDEPFKPDGPTNYNAVVDYLNDYDFTKKDAAVIIVNCGTTSEVEEYLNGSVKCEIFVWGLNGCELVNF